MPDSSTPSAIRATMYTKLCTTPCQYVKGPSSDSFSRNCVQCHTSTPSAHRATLYTKLCTTSQQCAKRLPSDVLHKILYNVPVHPTPTKRHSTQNCVQRLIHRAPTTGYRCRVHLRYQCWMYNLEFYSLFNSTPVSSSGWVNG